MIAIDGENYLTTTEVMGALGIKAESTLLDWVKAGLLKRYKFGQGRGRNIYKQSELKNLIQEAATEKETGEHQSTQNSDIQPASPVTVSGENRY